MSEVAPRQGFAARLLQRAEGRVTALRPSIASTFSAETTQEAPLVERTEEIAATPPKSQGQAPYQSAVAAPTHLRTEAAPSRLMPVERPHGPPPALLPDVPRPVSHPDVDAEVGVTAYSALPAEIARDAAVPPRSELRRADSLSSAVMQLLGPQPGENSFGAPAPEPQPAPGGIETSRFGTPVTPEPTWGVNSPDAGPADQAPLQIHIGELVIAPEQRAPVREEAPRKVWEPPLSLADYRASRSRERA